MISARAKRLNQSNDAINVLVNELMQQLREDILKVSKSIDSRIEMIEIGNSENFRKNLVKVISKSLHLEHYIATSAFLKDEISQILYRGIKALPGLELDNKKCAINSASHFFGKPKYSYSLPNICSNEGLLEYFLQPALSSANNVLQKELTFLKEVQAELIKDVTSAPTLQP